MNDLPEIDLGEVADTMETANEIKFGHTAVGYPKLPLRMDAGGLESESKILIESEGNQVDSKFSHAGHLRSTDEIEILHPDRLSGFSD